MYMLMTLIVVMVLEVYTYFHIHCIIHTKYVPFVIYQLYLKKIFFKKENAVMQKNSIL